MGLPEDTVMSLDAISDWLREPWEENVHVRFIGVSKTNAAVRKRLHMTEKMFCDVKEFQEPEINFTWTIEQ